MSSCIEKMKTVLGQSVGKIDMGKVSRPRWVTTGRRSKMEVFPQSQPRRSREKTQGLTQGSLARLREIHLEISSDIA